MYNYFLLFHSIKKTKNKFYFLRMTQILSYSTMDIYKRDTDIYENK